MLERLYTTKEAVLHRAQELVAAKKTFGELDASGRINARNKGDLGQIIEENWYGYTPNSDSDPDFAEAGVELKVSPYKITTRGISAKERLVCDIINYVEEANKTFETSAFWHKCRCIILLSYRWSEGVEKKDMFVDHATLLNEYPEEDLLIIRQDWETIIQKIRAGEAHLLTEGDTNYLAACTKGASAETVRAQPYSPIPAKQRAYSLKSSYMTRLLRRYVFGEEENEHIITDFRQLRENRFEDIILRMFQPYYGQNVIRIAATLGIDPGEVKIKSINSLVTRKMLGLTGNPDAVAEFKNANITVKTIVVHPGVFPEECMSFPAFKFMDLLNQEWDESDVYEQMVSARFLFVVFTRPNRDVPATLQTAFFWNMPAQDVDEVHRVWDAARASIRRGADLVYDGRVVKNSLPKQADSPIAHVRPHANKAAYILADGTVIGNPEKDANELPDGQWMTTQSFWFSKEYTRNIILQHYRDEYV